MDPKDVLNEVIAGLDAREAEKVAEAEKTAALRASIEAEYAAKSAEAIAAAKAEMAPAWKGGFATKKIVGKNDPKSERNDAVLHWLRTGDTIAPESVGYVKSADDGFWGGEEYAKAAMQEDTSSEGGFLVPIDFFDQIIARRNELSIVRKAGARVISTSRDSIQIPVEGTATTTFVSTAEEAASNQNEPVLDPITVLVPKWTKNIRISNELLADQAANLDQFIAKDLADKMAMTENRYAMVGTGSAQHLGIFVTDAAYAPTEYALTSDNLNGALTFANFITGAYGLLSEYRQEAAFFMHSLSEGLLRGLISTSMPLFPAGSTAAGAAVKLSQLLDRPVYNQRNIEQTSDVADSDDVVTYVVALGDMSYYALVERSGLEVVRNPWLYQATDQTGIFAKFRQGGAPIMSEAFTLFRAIINTS